MGMQKYPAPNQIKFTMSDIQSKITRHKEKQKNMTPNQERNQPKEIDPGLAHKLALNKYTETLL